MAKITIEELFYGHKYVMMGVKEFLLDKDSLEA